MKKLENFKENERIKEELEELEEKLEKIKSIANN